MLACQVRRDEKRSLLARKLGVGDPARKAAMARRSADAWRRNAKPEGIDLKGLSEDDWEVRFT